MGFGMTDVLVPVAYFGIDTEASHNMSKSFRDLGNNTMGLTWIDRIDDASSPVEIMDIARVYVASLSPPEIAVLPPKCRPRKLVDTDDVAEYAFDLVREMCSDPEPSTLVLKLAAVMSH